MSPVRRHLTTVRVRISFGPDRRKELLEGRHAELQTESAITVVGIEPVVSGPQGHPGGDQHRFVARAADLKENLVLSFELNLFIVEAAGQIHRPINSYHLLT